MESLKTKKGWLRVMVEKREGESKERGRRQEGGVDGDLLSVWWSANRVGRKRYCGREAMQDTVEDLGSWCAPSGHGFDGPFLFPTAIITPYPPFPHYNSTGPSFYTVHSTVAREHPLFQLFFSP